MKLGGRVDQASFESIMGATAMRRSNPDKPMERYSESSSSKLLPVSRSNSFGGDRSRARGGFRGGDGTFA